MYIPTNTKGWTKELDTNGWCLVDTLDNQMILICHGTDAGDLHNPLCYAIALGNQIKGVVCCFPRRIASKHPEIAHLILGDWDGLTTVERASGGISFFEQ